MSGDDAEIEAYYTRDGENETVRITHGSFLDGEYTDLDIRDALFLQWQLAGAIDDYTKAAGR